MEMVKYDKVIGQGKSMSSPGPRVKAVCASNRMQACLRHRDGDVSPVPLMKSALRFSCIISPASYLPMIFARVFA